MRRNIATSTDRRRCRHASATWPCAYDHQPRSRAVDRWRTRVPPAGTVAVVTPPERCSGAPQARPSCRRRSRPPTGPTCRAGSDPNSLAAGVRGQRRSTAHTPLPAMAAFSLAPLAGSGMRRPCRHRIESAAEDEGAIQDEFLSGLPPHRRAVVASAPRTRGDGIFGRGRRARTFQPPIAPWGIRRSGPAHHNRRRPVSHRQKGFTSRRSDRASAAAFRRSSTLGSSAPGIGGPERLSDIERAVSRSLSTPR